MRCPAEQDADAAHQIDGADDGPALAVDLGERLAAAAPCPGPTARSAWPAACPPRAGAWLTGWSRQDRPAALHQVAQQVAARPLRQVVGDRPVGNVVRRLRLASRRRTGPAPSAAIDEDVAIADAGMEFEPALPAGPSAPARRASAGPPRSAAWPSSLVMWPAVKSRISSFSTVTRLQRMAQSSGPSGMPIAAVSSGARPV